MQLEIINYMCHEYLKIDITGFSILKAPNDSGKSAIMFAIYDLINGGTNNYITRGKDYCKISLIDGENVISRISDKGKQTVVKNGEIISNTKHSFEKIGIDLPIELFGQHEKIFLLSETPKNRAEILNDIFDIENLENGFSELKKDLKSDQKELLDNENNLELLEDKKSKIEELIKLTSKYNLTYEKLGLLKSIKSKLDSKIILPNIITQDIISRHIVELLDAMKSKINSKVYIGDKILIDIDTKKLNMLNKLSSKLKSKVKIPEVIDIDIDTSELKLLSKIDSLRSKNVDVTSLQEKFNKINENLKGEVCPLCQNKM